MFNRRMAVALVLLVGACGNGDKKEDPGEQQFQFGVGTFVGHIGNNAVAWLSVDSSKTIEVLVFDGNWPDGLQTTTALSYKHVSNKFSLTPTTLKAWILANENLAEYGGNPFAPGGLLYDASDVELPTAAESPAAPGIGTFRVKREGTVMAWLSIESNRTERWIMTGAWNEIRDGADLIYEEVLVDQAFTSHAALRYWIENNPVESKHNGDPLSPNARLHEEANE